MDNEFFKPYYDEIYNVKTEKRYFVYDREKLRIEPIFPYLVLDGGAFFLMNEKFGGTDAKTLLEKTLSGEVFDFIRDKDGKINWGISYEKSAEYGINKKHEWQSWPQRLYMLLPLAQEYMKTGDRKYSDKWFEIFSKWVEECPYETFNPELNHVYTSMKWRDMQISWRTLTIIYSVYMLGQNSPFDKNQWKYIYDFLELSFNHLVLECEYNMGKNMFGNHVLQKASGLVTGAVMFPEMKDSQKYLEVGEKTMLFCHENSILADGCSTEASPSYSHFIARLYVEAEMNLERNGYPQMDGIHDSIIRQYQWLAKMSYKNGRTVRTGDCYGMDAHADICRVAEIVGFTPDFTKKTEFLKDSQTAMIRGDRTELFFDGMKHYGGHQHGSRLNLIYYVDGTPVLTELGCCSYDWQESYHTVGNKASHNVVYSNDFALWETQTTVEDVTFDEKTNTVSGKVTYKDKNHELVWKRTACLDGMKLTIKDEIKADKPLNVCGNFFFADKGMTLDDIWYMGDELTSKGEESEFKVLHGLDLVTVKSTEKLTLSCVPCLNDDNQQDRATRLRWNDFTDEKTVITEIML